MLLCNIWSLIMDVKDAANAQGKSEGSQSKGMGKRKRDDSDAGQTSGHSIQSKMCTQQGGTHQSELSRSINI